MMRGTGRMRRKKKSREEGEREREFSNRSLLIDSANMGTKNEKHGIPRNPRNSTV
jgi:hypothetical protein